MSTTLEEGRAAPVEVQVSEEAAGTTQARWERGSTEPSVEERKEVNSAVAGGTGTIIGASLLACPQNLSLRCLRKAPCRRLCAVTNACSALRTAPGE